MDGIPTNYIDTYLVCDKGVYHAYKKGALYLEHAIARKLEGPYELVQTGEEITTNRFDTN